MLYKQCLSNLQILLRVRNKNHISFLLFIVKERNNLAFGFYFLSHLVFAILQSFRTLTEAIVFFCNFEHFFLKQNPY